MLLAESLNTFALTCALHIAPSVNAVLAMRKIAAYRTFASIVASMIENPAMAVGPVIARNNCRWSSRQLSVGIKSTKNAPTMYGGTVKSCCCTVVRPG